MFRRKRKANDFGAEIEAHIQLEAERLREQGLSEEDARAAARRAFGNVTQTQERFYESGRWLLWDYFWQDLRFALRLLRKSPGFTFVAIATLAVAIGANAVVFSALNAFLLRPLNVPASESLYGLQFGGGHRGALSYPNYVDFRDRNRSFDGLAMYQMTRVGLDTGKNPTRAWLYEVSGNYFDVLKLQPYLGRFFHASDEHGAGSAPYIVLSYAYWHGHFQDDTGVVGRRAEVNKRPYTIIGVAPAEFRGTFLLLSPDFFVPMVSFEDEESLNRRTGWWIFETIGHLKAGVTPQQAAGDLNGIGDYLQKTYPKDIGKMNVSLTRAGLYGDTFGRPIRGFVGALMLLAALILLAACANLGSLFAWNPFPQFPTNVPLHPDPSVYAVAAVLAFLSGILFGAVPVRQVLHTDPYEIVKSGSVTKVGRRITFREALVAVQIAICALLVTSSMVAVRGLMRSLHSNFGFEPDDVILADTDLAMAGYSDAAVPVMQKRMIEAMQTIPGVTAVGLADCPPLAGCGASRASIFTDETTDLSPSNVVALPMEYEISPEFFTAAGTPLLAGRAFSWHDDKNAPRVAVINETFARKIFGSQANALGRYYKSWNGTRIQVVGVVRDGKYTSLTEEPQAATFVPTLQSPSSQSFLIVRSQGDSRQLAGAIRSSVRDLDGGLPVFIQTWPEAMDFFMFGSRMATASL